MCTSVNMDFNLRQLLGLYDEPDSLTWAYTHIQLSAERPFSTSKGFLL